MADKQIKTGGGSAVEGDVDTGGGDFTGRDRINQPVQQVTSTTNVFRENPTLGVLAVVAILAMLILGIIGIYALSAANRPGVQTTPPAQPAVTPINVGETSESVAETTIEQAALSLTATTSTAAPLLNQVQTGDTPTAPATAQPTPGEPAADPPVNGQSPTGGRIGVNQTVSGTLLFDEGHSWIFGDGPAVVDILLSMGPQDAALLMVFDVEDIQRQYVEAQTPGEARLLNYSIPDDGEYTLFVRNQNNTRADYTLTVQPAKPPEIIRLGETVTGTVFYNEGHSWIFGDGPAIVDILLSMGPQDAALLIVSDADGVQRQYVEAQTPGEARLLNYSIPDDGEYTLFVRNQNNTRASYTLTIQAASALENP
jgi:hypothetical protein